MFNSKSKLEAEKNSQLSKKLGQTRKHLNELKARVEELEQEKSKNVIIMELTELLTGGGDFDILLINIIKLLKRELHSAFGGLFRYNLEDEEFTYWKGTVYRPEKMPTIPLMGSIMGESIQNESIIAVDDMDNRYYKIGLNQEPKEYNVLLVPIIINSKPFAIIRLANMSNSYLQLGAEVLTSIAPLAVKMLEYIQRTTIGDRVIKGMRSSLLISRLLEKSVGKLDIIQTVFNQIGELIDTSGRIVAIKNGEEFIIVNTDPSDFALGGSKGSQQIYLRNLMHTYPSGQCVIKNIHKDKRWSWPDMNHHSLCMTALTIQDQLVGVIIVTSGQGRPFGDTEQTLLSLVSSQTSITLERADYFQKQEQFASKDGLTGLYNRRMFNDHVRKEVLVALRYKRTSSLIMFDIDHFKIFNDNYGHDMGDQVLKLVAKLVSDTVRSSDFVYRYGGEEFIIICSETPGENGKLLAERIRCIIANDRSIPNIPPVTISLGVSQIKEGDNSDTILKRVDTLMYASKEGGRNMVTLG